MFMLGEYVAIVTMCALGGDPVPGRLAAADSDIPPLQRGCPGVVWFVLEGVAASSSCSRW
jgi:hypothetical protein